MKVPKRYLKTLKQEVKASKGVVVTNHPIASAAGIGMLVKGGNAFDAAIASLFTLSVVEPMMVSPFGAGFFVYRNGKTGEISTLDNYAVAPLAATEDLYSPVKERTPNQYLFETEGRKNMLGHLSIATPGTLKAWEQLLVESGVLSLKEVMAPAINVARNGYAATPFLAFIVDKYKEDIKRFKEISKIFLPGGKVLKKGMRVTMPDYAETLEWVSEKGSDLLYKGDLGKLIVDDLEENEGILTRNDLASYKLHKKDPVHGTYRDRYEVYSMAPGSSGGTHIIQMLNMLENYDVSRMGPDSPEYLHLFSEVLKIAFADRQHYLGDPLKIKVPITGLCSKKYAVKRIKEINEKANIYSFGEATLYEGENQNTTHLSVMDSEGNVIAATQTLFSAFGSMVMSPGTGMLLNNCMGLFDPRPGRANSVAGGKRMLSSMAPTIVTKDDAPFLCIGTPGGTKIFPAVCQAIVNLIDFGMNIQQAVEAPRVWTMGIPGTPEGKLQVEPDFDEKTLEELKRRGHAIAEVPKIAGGMNGVLVGNDGFMYGGACWRADGTPIGISGGEASPKALISTFKV